MLDTLKEQRRRQHSGMAERGTHGRGEAQIAQYPLDQGKDAGFVLSRMRAMDGCRSQKAHSSCCLEGRQGAGCAAG